MNFEQIVANLASPVSVFSPIEDEQHQIIDFNVDFANAAFHEMTGHIVQDAPTFKAFEKNLVSEIPWFEYALQIMRGIPVIETNYYSPANKNWYKAEMKKVEDNKVIVVFTNITTEKLYTQKLKETANTDILTGLTNRSGFPEALDIAIDTARYENTMLALLLLDLDDLKIVNDSKGTEAGDEILKRTAIVLKRFCRDTIQVFRYGGDEFMVMLSNIDSMDSVYNITDTLYEALRMEDISVSGGISVFPHHTESKQELMRFADMAIHTSKQQGKNRFTFFNIEMERIFVQKLTMRTKMNTAVLDSNFSLYYQPQFDIQTSQLRGFEALIRWVDPELGEIPPSVFIPLAEENGLILPIGKWVLNTAMATLRKWQKQFNFTGIISVNISPVQMKQDNFIFELRELLKKYDIIPQYMEIEITEGVMINDMEETIEKLHHIKNMGFRVSLDDFGTGYSSLNYLQVLPLNTLKIDKSFINNITSRDGIQANITSSIINMVSKMGLETIAEGVEQNDQLDMLKGFNCNIVQGFLRGKPMPTNICERYLSGDKDALLTNQ